MNEEQLNNALIQISDIFRGTLDPASYKDYLLAMVFLKYLSDLQDQHHIILPEVEYNNLTFKASLEGLYQLRDSKDIGTLLNLTFRSIVNANQRYLFRMFERLDFDSELTFGKDKDRLRILKYLIEECYKIPSFAQYLTKSDIIGNAYIHLIERLAADAWKRAGEFFTPLPITKLIAQLVAPKKGDTVCDPTCGSGSLLLQVAALVDGQDIRLFGQESNRGTWELCRMNMFIHGFLDAVIAWGDTLNSPQLINNKELMQFNCVVANPPFSLTKWGAENAANDHYRRFYRGIPPKSKGDWAFISHMLAIALPKVGRVAVVVPLGVLFRGASEGRIRRQVIEENLLDAVIGLPSKLFPSTGIPVAIMVFDRSREKSGAREECKNVFFIDASREFVAGKNQNSISEENIAKIVSTYQQRSEISKYSHLASLEELQENDFNLNISRYIDTFEEEEEIDVMAIQKQIIALDREIASVETKIAQDLKELFGE